MKTIGIITASDNELAPFLDSFQPIRKVEKAMLTFHECRHGNATIIAVYSGVCKVNAAIAAQILADCFHADCIISAGTCGGLANKVKLFDTIIASACVYHDVEATILTEFHPWMPEAVFQCLPALSAGVESRLPYPVHFGILGTGEFFLDSEEQRKKLLAAHPDVLGVDMESCAIAHVCYVNEIPFLAVRTVTDTGESGGEDVFFANVDKASERSCAVCRELLNISGIDAK